MRCKFRTLSWNHITSCLILSISISAFAQKPEIEIARGVRYRQERVGGTVGPLVINILSVKMTEPGIHVETGIAQDIIIGDDVTKGREAVAPLAKRHHAVAAVNADFFPFTGDPLNIAIRNGEFLSEPMSHRVAMGITATGKILFDTLICSGKLTVNSEAMRLDGINRLPGKDEITVLTPAYAARRRTPPTMITAELSGFDRPVHVNTEQTGKVNRVSEGEEDRPIAKGSVILVGSGAGAQWLNAHLKPDDSVKLNFLLSPNPLPERPDKNLMKVRAQELFDQGSSDTWSDVENAVGGGPWLVKDGKQYVDGLAESVNQNSFTMARHPRTAVGVTKDGILLLVTIDGRQSFSKGITLPETADIMIRLGAINAINLDGGGSTAMVVKDLYVNSPSDGTPRPVADALLILQSNSVLSKYAETRKFNQLTVTAGEEVSLPEVWHQMGLGATLPDWWGTENGTSFVDQAGMFFGSHAGTATVIGTGTIIGTLPILVKPGLADRIVPTVKKVELPDTYSMEVLVTDKYKNPVPNVGLSVRVKGAPTESYSLTTDAAGKASLIFTWPLDLNTPIEISTPGIATVQVKRPFP